MVSLESAHYLLSMQASDCNGLRHLSQCSDIKLGADMHIMLPCRVEALTGTGLLLLAAPLLLLLLLIGTLQHRLPPASLPLTTPVIGTLYHRLPLIRRPRRLARQALALRTILLHFTSFAAP